MTFHPWARLDSVVGLMVHVFLFSVKLFFCSFGVATVSFVWVQQWEGPLHSFVYSFIHSFLPRPALRKHKLTQVEWELGLVPKELDVCGVLIMASMDIRS